MLEDGDLKVLSGTLREVLVYVQTCNRTTQSLTLINLLTLLEYVQLGIYFLSNFIRYNSECEKKAFVIENMILDMVMKRLLVPSLQHQVAVTTTTCAKLYVV